MMLHNTATTFLIDNLHELSIYDINQDERKKTDILLNDVHTGGLLKIIIISFIVKHFF